MDVFSPNHLEIARLFGISESADYKKPDIEKLALEVLRQGVGPEGNGVVLVRAGEMGCLVQSRKVAPKWLPPFYGEGMGKEQSYKVVDPTGAGNAFLGAYSIGYLRTEDIIEAACYGSVAASFALEQVGMPTTSKEGDQELWNGVNVLKRLQEYKKSIGTQTG